MATEHPYPHLSPELRRLSGDSLAFWGDAAERGRALAAVLAAWDGANGTALRSAIDRIDRAVLAGLEALALPRDPASAIRLVGEGRTWLARVTLDGSILIEAERLRYYLRLGMADRVAHAWVHESIHARRASSFGRSAESAAWTGYEEGLAEGLARTVTEWKAGISVPDRSYEYFVQAYQGLARAGGFEAERLWRLLWRHRPGEVRRHFARAVDDARREVGAALLSPKQHSRLVAVADRVFAAGRIHGRPDAAALSRLWELVFR
jgi:hypothetical protein